MRTGARVGEGDSHYNLDPQPLSVGVVMLVAESDKRISCRHISPLVTSHEFENHFVPMGEFAPEFQAGRRWPTPIYNYLSITKSRG